MEYSEVLEDMIMRPWHAIIYGEEKERHQYLSALAQKYSFQMSEKRPVGIYIQDSGLEDSHNKDCETWRLSSFQRVYFEFLVAWNILDKLLKDLSSPALSPLEEEILESFHVSNIKSLEELKQELEKSKNMYKEEYYNYIKSGNIKENFQKEMQVEYIMLEYILRRLKDVLKQVSYFALFIDKQNDFGRLYTQVINTYIASRSTGYLVVNIGCNNGKDWKNYYALNGQIIENPHDYTDITMKEWVRKRENK